MRATNLPVHRQTQGCDRTYLLGRVGLCRVAGEKPEEVGKTVKVGVNDGTDVAPGFSESDNATFGAAGGGAGKVKSCGGDVVAGDYPAVKLGQIVFFEVKDRFDPVDAVGAKGVTGALQKRGGAAFIAGDLAHDGDEVALDVGDESVGFGFRAVGAGQTERGGKFVTGTERFDLRVRLGDALSGQKIGFPRITASRCDGSSRNASRVGFGAGGFHGRELAQQRLGGKH